jgi:curved DNA-binding protein CbpA
VPCSSLLTGRSALKYHPDRNPGREEEVNSQFLIIQAAHDVLTDPQQKAKYDATRKSGAGRYPGASGVRGNPWSDVGAQYPTPPRRNNQSTRNPTSSGADRWNSRFSAGAPPTAKAKAGGSHGAETKKSAATAFDKMRPKKGPPPPTPPRAEYARQRAEASFGTSKANRASGYQPGASTYGDEPSVSNSNYSTRRDASGVHQQPSEGQIPQKTPMPDPLRQFREETLNDSRKNSSYQTHGGEKTNLFEGANVGRSKSTREPPGRTTSSSHDAPSSTSSRPRSATEHSKSAPSSESEKSQAAKGSGDSPNDQKGQKSDGESFSKAQNGPRRKPPIFDISDSDDEPQPAGFGKRSVDEINTSFVNDSNNRKWEFSAGSSDQAHYAQSRPQQGVDQQSSQPARQPTGPDSQRTNGSTQAKSSGDGAFHAEGWSDQFGPQTFVPPARNISSASPSKAGRKDSKKSKSTKLPNGENVIVIDDSSDEDTFTWRGRKTQPNEMAADSPQAMDIDSPPAEPTTSSPLPNGARNIPVEPSRPEWRSGDFTGVEKDIPTSAPKTANTTQKPVGSEDSEEFKASFADFKNVAPFAHQNDGLKSFGEMKDQLPFESKAADPNSIGKVPNPQPLAFPEAPRAPRLPPTMAVSGLQPTMPSWEKYSSEFESYMKQWDIFHGLVTDHFATRNSQIAGSRQTKGYDFLRRNEGDCLDYFKSVQQDNDIRRRWNAACEEHELRLAEFIAFRDKMS